MQKTLFLLTLVAISATLAFNTPYSSPNEGLKTGTYGVCDFGEGPSSALIALTLNEDQTFHYINQTDPDHKVDVTGKWDIQKNVVILEDYTSSLNIRDKWKLDNDSNCLKSRKGMNFTRICYLKSCK